MNVIEKNGFDFLFLAYPETSLDDVARNYFYKPCILAELPDSLLGCSMLTKEQEEELSWVCYDEGFFPQEVTPTQHKPGAAQNEEQQKLSFHESVLQDTAAGRERLCQRISQARLSRQDNGFLHTDGVAYPINVEAQVAYMGQINAAQLGLHIQCFAHSMDNRQVEMTCEEMMALAAGVMAACEKINKEAWKAKEEIRAAETLEEAWTIYAAYFGLTDAE